MRLSKLNIFHATIAGLAILGSAVTLPVDSQTSTSPQGTTLPAHHPRDAKRVCRHLALALNNLKDAKDNLKDIPSRDEDEQLQVSIRKINETIDHVQASQIIHNCRQ